MPAEGFPKSVRLRKRREFLTVQRGGRRVVTDHFVVYGRQNGGRPMRVGITVSKKVGAAHQRNRIKRWVREAFRRLRGVLPAGFDVVLVARHESPPSDLLSVTAELRGGVRRLRDAPPRSRRRRRS